MSNENKCLIKLTKDALLIANTGQPFSRRGVISVCASHRGTKKERPPDDLFKGGRDSDLPKEIRKKEIETYQRDRNRLFDDYNQEVEVSSDYGGRFFWELLQNADDAMCPINTSATDLIGLKGLGFKSVLEITDKPAIYSAPFHFYFSAEDNYKLLEKIGVKNPPQLTFRIPHDHQDNEDMIDLVEDYSTIISLPFKNQEAQKKVKNKLKKLNVFFLLLSQYVETIEVIWPNGRNRQWKISRENNGELNDGDISIQIIESGSVKKPQKFRRWANIWNPEAVGKRHSVACCLPLNSADEVQAWDETFPLYSFFPTKELLPFRALFHASFDLDQSRKHVRDPENKVIHKQLEILLKRILDDIPANISLRAFYPKNTPNEDTLAYVLWKVFESVLRQTKFIPCIGDKKETPPKTKLWDCYLGNVLRPNEEKVIEQSLVEAELIEDHELRKALESLGAEPLENENHLILLRYCKNDNRHDCQKALRSFFSITKNIKYLSPQKTDCYLKISRRIPCWWNVDGRARSLSDELPFLRKHPEVYLPDWLQFDTLDHKNMEFLKEIERKAGNDLPKIWKEILQGKLLNDKSDELLIHLLVPTISSNKKEFCWEQHGSEVLHLYQSLANGINFKNDPVAIWHDEDRKRLGHSLHLPTDKGWLPAWQCYAGASWGGPESFDLFFKDIKERGVLDDPHKWPVNIDENKNHHWGKILRYAGVSWEMKIVCAEVADGEIQRKSGSWWTECPFSLLSNEEDWSEYLASLDPPNFNKRIVFDLDTKIHENWEIEFFPDALPDDLFSRLKVIKPIAKEAKDSQMKYSFQKTGKYPGRRDMGLKSFAAWQIENSSWMSCKKSLLDNRLMLPPDKAYMPGKGIGGLLPEINIKIPEGQDGRDLATFLTQTIDVREGLPSAGEVTWKDWFEKLPDAVRRTSDHNVAIKATRMLYRRFLEIHDERPEWFDEIPDIPCLQWDMENKIEQLRFLKSSEIYWLDEPYLAESNARNELLQRVNIFILEQEQGEKASDLFAIKPLSKIVYVKPKFYKEDQDTTHIIQKRYAERFNSLKVASGSANLPKPEDLKILAVDTLRLEIFKEEEVISAPKVRNWKENDLTLLDSFSKWEALGLALAQGQTRKGLSNLFENLLRAREGNEVIQRLRDLGVPETAIDDLENDFQTAIDTNINEVLNEELTERKTPVEDVTQEPEYKPESSEFFPTDTRGSGNRGKGKTVSGQVSQSRRKKGEDAENWIRSKISDLLSITHWGVSGQPERDNLNRESDIVLFHPDLGKYHIEVKHVETGEIFWSEREVSKAKDHKGKYWMVVVRPGYKESDQNVIWFWNPLEDLISFPRRSKWIWRSEADDLDAEVSGWDVPSPRKKQEANNFSFVIKVRGDFFDSHCPSSSKGLTCLKEKLNLTNRGLY